MPVNSASTPSILAASRIPFLTVSKKASSTVQVTKSSRNPFSIEFGLRFQRNSDSKLESFPHAGLGVPQSPSPHDETTSRHDRHQHQR